MRKMVVLGLDCATFKLLNPWIRQGKLPNFKKLMKEGSYGILKSTLPPTTPVAWPSFFTGVNPGKHGVFGFTKLTSDYKMKVCLGDDVRALPIWDVIGRLKGKTALINLPMIYPPRKINGVMITGLETPSEFSEYTYPKRLKQDLRKIVGKKYLIHPLPYRGDNEEEFLRSINETLEMRFKLIDYYMKKRFDLIVSIIAGTDKVTHGLWKYIDKTSPLFSKVGSKKWLGRIIEYYQHIDRLLGGLMSKLGNDYSLIIVSDHGGDKIVMNFNPSEWLRRKGLLVLKKRKKQKSFFFISMKKANAIAKFFEEHGMSWVKRLAKTVVPWRTMFVGGKEKITLDEIKWGKTKVFVTPEGSMYINSKDRFKQGIVGEKEYYALRKNIVKDLKNLRGPNGEKFKVIVKERESVYKGPYTKEAPDIIYFINNVEHHSNKGVLWRMVSGTEVSGGHSMDGVFFAYGKDIVKNRKVRNARIIDVAPTILYLMGLPVPEEMDGRILNIFKARRGKKDSRKTFKNVKVGQDKEVIVEVVKDLEI